MFKTRLALLGTILGIYGILNFFWFFENISKTRPSIEHWAKNFCSKILTENMFRTRLDTFGNDFGLFWNFEKFWFFEIISKTRPYMEHWAKKNFSNSTPKHVQSTFGQLGNNFGRFWNFESFLIFWKHFEDSTLHGTLGKIIFSKQLPQNKFKTLLESLGTILVVFGIFNFFWFFFKNISKTRPSVEHWAK